MASGQERALSCERKSCRLLPSGALFIKEKDLTITGESWTVASMLDIERYDALSLQLTDVVFSIIDNVTNVGLTIPEGEKVRLREGLLRLRSMTDQLKFLMEDEDRDGVSVRSKRAIFDSVGAGLKLAFGTMDSEDFRTINSRFKTLADVAEELTHFDDEQLSYVRSLQDGLRITRDDVRYLAKLLDEKLVMFEEYKVIMKENVNQLNFTLKLQNELYSLIRSVEFVMQGIHTELIQVQGAIDSLSRGHVTSALISPYKLSDLLTDLERRLPDNLSLLVSPQLPNIHFHYTLCKGYGVKYSKGIRVVFKIPLKSQDRQMELFKILVLPVFDASLGKYVSLVGISQYLAFAPDRQRYALISDDDLRHCTDGAFALCEPVFPVHVRPEDSCEASLFLEGGLTLPSGCSRTVHAGSVPTEFHRLVSKDYWVYSTAEDIILNFDCKNEVKRTTIKISGAGILPNSGHCSIYSPKFVLLPYSTGRSNFTSISDVSEGLVVPNITSLLHPYERQAVNEYQQRVLLDKDLLPLHDIISRVVVPGRNFSHLTSILHQIHLETKQFAAWQEAKSWYLGATMTLILLGLVLFAVCYFQSIVKCFYYIWLCRRSGGSRHSSISLPRVTMEREVRCPTPTMYRQICAPSPSFNTRQTAEIQPMRRCSLTRCSSADDVNEIPIHEDDSAMSVADI